MLKEQDVRNWPIWGCGPSTFDWHYDQAESCYILEGKIRVKTPDQEVDSRAGGFVTFSKGLDCVWTVTRAVRKHHAFS
jgi:hypothetical protein